MTQFVKLTTVKLNDLLINMEKVMFVEYGEADVRGQNEFVIKNFIDIHCDNGKNVRLNYPENRQDSYEHSVDELLDFYHEKKGNRDPTEKIRALLDKKR